MADSNIPVPSGDLVDVTSLTRTDGSVVKRERVSLGDATDPNAIAKVDSRSQELSVADSLAIESLARIETLLGQILMATVLLKDPTSSVKASRSTFTSASADAINQ